MNSFISWIGGKKLLRDQIIARFPAEIGRYIEVFGGAAWVLSSNVNPIRVKILKRFNRNYDVNM